MSLITCAAASSNAKLLAVLCGAANPAIYIRPAFGPSTNMAEIKPPTDVMNTHDTQTIPRDVDPAGYLHSFDVSLPSPRPSSCGRVMLGFAWVVVRIG
jgi:hypothetical protein